jgi:hypothetical protein
MSERSELVVSEGAEIVGFQGAGGIELGMQIAKPLADMVEAQGLSVRIGQGKHLRVEAWCALGAMVGVSPRTVWTEEARNPETGQLEGYEARVEVVRSGGDVIGAAESGCYRDESRWRTAERHAIKSMAQTRATSKALGQVLRWIPELAGYSGTPAEEMPPQEPAPAPSPPPRPPVVEILGDQTADTKGQAFGERHRAQISESQANAIVALAVQAGKPHGMHGFHVLNKVLKKEGFEPCAVGSKKDDALLHLCDSIRPSAFGAFCKALEAFTPAPEEPF